MVNRNCLADIRCPECLNEDEFFIDACVLAVVTDDGAEPATGDFSWDANSPVRCSECNHAGIVSEFTIAVPTRKGDQL